jgi:hypothetical protein
MVTTSSRVTDGHGDIARSVGTDERITTDGITIDCDICTMRNTEVCAECVVTFLCDREPNEAVLLDLDEVRALRRLADAGLAPRLRHRPR